MFDLTLTFDNGPEPGVTPRVLDILRERGIKTTFFVIGEKLGDPERRRLAARAHGEGHWIGNHTFTHTVPLGLQHDAETAQNEIGRTQAAIGDLAHPHRWFRPFGGGGNLDERLLKPSVVEYLTRNKHSCVLWNAIPRDWDDPGRLGRPGPGAVPVAAVEPDGPARPAEWRDEPSRTLYRPRRESRRAFPPGLSARLRSDPFGQNRTIHRSLCVLY